MIEEFIRGFFFKSNVFKRLWEVCVGAFNDNNMEISQELYEAQENSSLDLQESAGALNCQTYIFDEVVERRRRYRVPICLHLDHARFRTL
jgi:fructose/tagatose bisphosphate aldolase